MGHALAPHISLEEAKRHLKYCHKTGTFERIFGHLAGTKVGRVESKGYLQIGLCGRRYMAHRLGWWFHHGQWPNDQIDHINGNKLDNRIENLDVVDQSTNLHRRGARRDNSSGHVGVGFHKATGKWCAYICVNKKQNHLGVFSKIKDAIAARQDALQKRGLS